MHGVRPAARADRDRRAGLDGVVAAVARTRGDAQRAITGTVTQNGVPQPGVHVTRSTPAAAI